MLVMVQGTMPRDRRTRLQPVADGVDKLLFESDPPEALVARLQGWMGMRPEFWSGAGWHETHYRPERWQGIGHWPAQMPTRPAGDATQVPQSRRDVTQVAQGCRVSGCWLELLVAVVVWGYKPADFGPSRLAKMLQCDCHSQVSSEQRQQRLASAVSILDDYGPVAAYRALRDDCRVPHLGPAFFSKFLYFADASINRKAGDRVAAIILDQTTAQRMISVSREYLRASGPHSSAQHEAITWVWHRSNWSGHRYGIYCEWASRCAKYMAETHRWPQDADLIELALFKMTDF